MTNVKGCGSLAHTKNLNKFEIITEEKYNELLSGTTTIITNFMGAHETKEVQIIEGI